MFKLFLILWCVFFSPALLAQSVLFINPGKSDEIYWVSATRALIAQGRKAKAQAADGKLDMIAIAVTASFGIAEFIPGEIPADLLARADAMLYQAKQTGRNRVCCSGN